MTDAQAPRVTVGIMAYNEEKHLAATLDSILSQSFSDYEIIIADNASEDDTSEIARAYAARNPFIRVLRHERNIGALQNFNTLVREARGEYFVLAGAHDLWSDNFLANLSRRLDEDPEVVLAYGITTWVDADGQPLDLKVGFIDTSGLDALARFNLVLWGNPYALYGMYRASALRKTRLQLEFIGSGVLLLSELAILGTFIVDQDVRWYRRQVRGPESTDQRIQRYYRVLFSKPRRRILPYWRVLPAYLGSILRIEIPFLLRLALLASAPNILLRFAKYMAYDVVLLVRRAFHRGTED